MDNKRERFQKLAEYRTNEVLSRLKILGNCANRSAYEYTEKDIKKIFNAIEARVKDVRAQFKFKKNKEEFRL